jgi:hypothetical protein
VALRNSGEETWHKRKKVLKSIAGCNEQDYSESGLREILLELQIAISGHQNIKTRVGRNAKELAILKSGPPALLNGADIVPADFPGEVTRQLFIEQHAHRLLKPRERSREPRSPVP